MTAPASARAAGGAETPVERRRARLACLAYALLTFAAYIVWRHFLAERSADEAIFENLLWNANHGNGLTTWLESEGGHLFPHLALHFSPVIWLLVALYRVAPSMHAVHLVVSVCTSAAGYFVYRLARQRLDATTSAFVMGAFLLNPTVVLQTFMEFHEQSLAMLPLILLVASYRRGAVIAGTVAALFLLSIREDNIFLVLAIGAMALLAKRDLRLGLALVALGIAWMGLYRWVVAVAGGGLTAGVFAGTYGAWGRTPGEAVRAMATDPSRVVRHLLGHRPLEYLAQLLAPFFLVLGFGDALVLAMAPQLLLILLANHDTRMFELRLHYSVVPVTMLTIGAIGTLARLGPRGVTLLGRRIPLPRLLAGAMFVAAAATVPLWMNRAVHRLNPRAAETRAVMALVPDTSSVTAPGYMINHMARRRRIGLTWVGPYTLNEYVILEEPNREFFPGITVETPFTPAVAETLRRAGYTEIHGASGWHVWRKPKRSG